MQKLLLSFGMATLLFSCDPKDGKKKTETTGTDSTIVKKTDSVSQTAPAADTVQLAIDPLQESADQAQVTFSEKGKTIFFYNLKTKKGKIKLNGTESAIDKFNFDSKTGSYSLSGGDVTIDAATGTFKPNKGEDCNYGTIKAVNITKGSKTLTVNNVDVQDCPNY